MYCIDDNSPATFIDNPSGLDKDVKIVWGFDSFTYNSNELYESNHIYIANYN